MKQVIWGMTAAIMVILIIFGALTVEGRTTRERKLQDSVQQAMAAAMREQYESDDFGEASKDALVAAFTRRLEEILCVGEETKGEPSIELDIKVAGADPIKGLLSVKVTETFTHPNGKKGTTSCEATAVIEQPSKQASYTVSFRYPNRLYKEYCLQEGTTFKKPAKPSVPDQAFVCWIDDESGEPAVFPDKVTKNHSYTAVFQ